jgi:hypothetical protein
MPKEKMKMSDKLKTEVKPESGQPQKVECIVVTDLFKNGKTYKKGEKISLEANTARRFKEAGNVKFVK